MWDGDEDGVACSCVRAFSARRVTCLGVGEAVPPKVQAVLFIESDPGFEVDILSEQRIFCRR